MAPRQASIPVVAIQRTSVDSQQEERTNQGEQANTGRITRWLVKHGVPVNNTRQQKSKKPKKPKKSKNQEGSTKTASSQVNITASNVTTMELETHFKWSFQATLNTVPIDNGELALDSISEVLNGITHLSGSGFTSQGNTSNRRIRTMISLPSEWIENTGPMPSDDGEAYWRQALMTFLANHDPNHKYVNFLSTDKIKAATYPNPNIFHIYNKKYEGGGISWTLANAFLSPTFMEQPNTEMEVEHLISGFLNGFLNVTECDTSSNAQLKFRNEIACFGSHSHPDFVSRIKMGIISEKRLKYDLYPATFLAEAKKKLSSEESQETRTVQSGHLQVPSESEKRLDFQEPLPVTAGKFPMAAQMAFAAYPSLVIIIAFLITQWRSKPKAKKPGREDYQIPEWAVIYGIGYASNGILVYAFFPRVIEWDQDNFPKKWGFMSLIVTTNFIKVFTEKERSKRFDLIRFLLLLQQHASRLKDRMKELILPEEFLG